MGHQPSEETQWETNVKVRNTNGCVAGREAHCPLLSWVIRRPRQRVWLFPPQAGVGGGKPKLCCYKWRGTSSALCIAKVWCGPNRLFTRPPPHQVYNWVRAKVTPGWVWHPQENMSLFSLKHPRVADHTYWLTHRCVSAFTHPPKTCTRQQWKCINMSICWPAAAPALLQLPFYMRSWAAAQQQKCAGG